MNDKTFKQQLGRPADEVGLAQDSGLFAIQCRVFNRIEIDPKRGMLKKISTHTDKLHNEARYYCALPVNLSVHFPSVVSFETAQREACLTMEYLPMPPLSRLWLDQSLPQPHWESLIAWLGNWFTETQCTREVPIKRSHFEAMYMQKTLQRLSEMETTPPFQALITQNREIRVNGRKCPSITKVLSMAESFAKTLYDIGRLGIIHGDLCFSNILYEEATRTVKLIDPRGSFGKIGIYGDLHYDLAKLYHCTHGSYDFIVNDRFELMNIGNDHYSLEMDRSPYHDAVGALFMKQLYEPAHAGTIEFASALLFLSMIPLHEGHAHRQLAMFVNAMQLFGKIG